MILFSIITNIKNKDCIEIVETNNQSIIINLGKQNTMLAKKDSDNNFSKAVFEGDKGRVLL